MNWPLIQRKIAEKLMGDHYYQDHLTTLIPKTADDLLYYSQYVSIPETKQAFCTIQPEFKNYCDINKLSLDAQNENEMMSNLWGYLISENNTNNMASISCCCVMLRILMNKENSEAINRAIEIGHDDNHKIDWLMNALIQTTLENNAEAVEKISALVITIFEKCEVHSLATGLSEKATAGANAGKNGFHWLMAALCNAASKNSAENTAKIAEVVLKVIEKLPLAVLIDFLKALDTNLRKKVYEIADKLPAADNLNKLKIALISKLMAYRDSNGIGPDDKNTSLGFFTLPSTPAKLNSAKKLMEEMITCSTAQDILSKIKEQQSINNKLDTSRKLLIGKSTYEKCLDDCLSKTSDYCTVELPHAINFNQLI